MTLLESAHFTAALAKEVARILVLRDERPIEEVPVGNFDIARRAGPPLGDQPSSKSRERKANQLLRPKYLPHINEAAPEESESYEKKSELTSDGGNSRKKFRSDSENDSIKNKRKKKNKNTRTTRGSSLAR